MSKKRKTKNVISIAIKLNAIQVRDLFFKFLIIDTIILIILIGLFLHKLNKRQFNVYNDTG